MKKGHNNTTPSSRTSLWVAPVADTSMAGREPTSLGRRRCWVYRHVAIPPTLGCRRLLPLFVDRRCGASTCGGGSGGGCPKSRRVRIDVCVISYANYRWCQWYSLWIVPTRDPSCRCRWRVSWSGKASTVGLGFTPPKPGRDVRSQTITPDHVVITPFCPCLTRKVERQLNTL